jgi:hypothetical protein
MLGEYRRCAREELQDGAAMPVGELQKGLHLRQGLPIDVGDSPVSVMAYRAAGRNVQVEMQSRPQYGWLKIMHAVPMRTR